MLSVCRLAVRCSWEVQRGGPLHQEEDGLIHHHPGLQALPCQVRLAALGAPGWAVEWHEALSSPCSGLGCPECPPELAVFKDPVEMFISLRLKEAVFPHLSRDDLTPG